MSSQERKRKKKREQSIIEKEFMAFLQFYIRAMVEQAFQDLFKDFK